MAIVLPKKIKIIYSDIGDTKNFYGVRKRGVHAQAVDASMDSMFKRALQWGQSQNVRINKIQHITSSNVYIDEVDNKPFSNIELYSIRHAANATRYHIITEKGFIFDMQERVFHEVVMQYGVDKGGKMHGEFIWTRENAHMRLVLAGSPLHKVCSKNTK
jgi:hypothetical protein